MREFSGLDYIKIDIANQFGLDRETWDTRIDWVNVHKKDLVALATQAKKFYLYVKAIQALKDAEACKPIGHIMYLDATASGLQIMAALSGCKLTASAVNMIDPFKRNDVYQIITDAMNESLDPTQRVTRDDVKKPLMTHFYNKMVQDTLTEEQQESFYNTLEGCFPGAEDIKYSLNSRWDSAALYHSWTLPDKHVSKVLVTEMVDYKIEIDELNHASFSFRSEVNRASIKYSSLCPNVIQSIDAYIIRELIRTKTKICPIHDAIGSHPNDMNHVRKSYIDIVAHIAESNLFDDILHQLGLDSKSHYTKYSNDLSNYIRQSEYMLS